MRETRDEGRGTRDEIDLVEEEDEEYHMAARVNTKIRYER